MRRFLALLPISVLLAACGGGGGGPAGGETPTGSDQMQTPTSQTTTKAPGY